MDGEITSNKGRPLHHNINSKRRTNKAKPEATITSNKTNKTLSIYPQANERELKIPKLE